MPQPAHLSPLAYTADGQEGTDGSRPVGILLLHGVPGSAAETRPMGQYLAARGLAVRCPLLPGHGTVPQDLLQIHRQHWKQAAENAFQELQQRCSTTFVGGLSMGSVLALHLAQEHPEIAGLILMAPAVKLRNRLAPLAPLLRHLLTYVPPGTQGDGDLVDPEAHRRSWYYDRLAMQAAAEFYLLKREVSRTLPRIHQPLLIFQGRHDAQVHAGAPQFLLDRVSSTNRQTIWLEHSGHNVLVDGEREAVWEQSYAWIMARAPSP